MAPWGCVAGIARPVATQVLFRAMSQKCRIQCMSARQGSRHPHHLWSRSQIRWSYLDLLRMWGILGILISCWLLGHKRVGLLGAGESSSYDARESEWYTPEALVVGEGTSCMQMLGSSTK